MMQRINLITATTVGLSLLATNQIVGLANVTDSNNTIWRKLQESDKILSAGSLSYSVRRIQNSNGAGAIDSLEILKYTRDGRFSHRVATLLKGGKWDVFKRVYDGEDEFHITGKQISILSKPTTSDSQALTTLYPGPCFVLGRGLSSLRNPTFESVASSKEVTITGEAIDGTIVRAVLDTKHDYVAKRIERTDKDNSFVNKVSLGHPVVFNNAPAVAVTALVAAKMTNGRFVGGIGL